MRQLTLRIPDELSEALKEESARRSTSVNRLARAVLEAAVNPDLEDDESAQLRVRLRRAGLLADIPSRRANPPDMGRLEAARRAAGQGKPLSELVSEGRR